MKKKRKKKLLYTADFFAGIGGFRMGFDKAGYKTAYANDIDSGCCKTYKANFGEIEEKDIESIDIDSLPHFNVLLAGFPCQPFSIAGKRKGVEDHRGKLVYAISKILNKKYPDAFVLENVKPLLTLNKGKIFKEIYSELEKCGKGYNITFKILNSINFGLPQKRERLYIVGVKKRFGQFNIPEKTNIQPPPIKALLEKNVPEKYYLTERYYLGLLQHKQRHAKNGNGFGCKILDLDGPANTLVAGNMGRERNLIKDKPNQKNKWGIRKLTERECARIQGFSDDFVIPVSTTQACAQFGNAVSVPVVEKIARNLKKHIS